ncbi:MAG TPA: sel1 repeat family protein [Burkholderiaceae bacterium]
MKTLLFGFLLMAITGVARADDLSDAKKLFEEKKFAEAMALYGKLANAGNAEAQHLLGEMYWYGDGMAAADDAKAELWFKKAADAGNVKAKAALGIMRDRVTRRADIEYYTTRYDGADLRYNCAKPAIPAVSKTLTEMKKVDADYTQWAQCYDAWAVKMNGALPAGKAIPADIANLLNDDELVKARTLMDKTYAGLSAQAQKEAAAVTAQNDAWRTATVAFAKTIPRGTDGRMLNEQELGFLLNRIQAENEARQRNTQGQTGRR